ncbi:Proline--tRNA ligase [Candidatus Westeberhardia cardiocondylae]|uniref:Proline--tRNA ligase n=1 Tax=Candidatus Westeberhardia cardiocondylae TaxID=1594731 RepID=A0A0H5BX33_9ENTR|nr:proline--tRNA ligase [Candidatus Westeberhardia cardiocondylae]CEN32297.1 Proline--tRNA ligase [Candidatus Westeberhardia cardiocondylae]
MFDNYQIEFNYITFINKIIMRISKYPLFTTKQVSSNINVVSYKLMLRSGIIRKLSSGLYSWLPIGLRVLRKIENILRLEMDNIGAFEISMPIMQPENLWRKSGRLLQYGSELLQFLNRSSKKFILCPTNEEVITDIMRHEFFSYKMFPLHFYQIQTKFRDELRPKFGVIRSREFLMKDSYSFHVNEKSLRNTYDVMHQMYENFFKRVKLKFFIVRTKSKSIGGDFSHEFHVSLNQYHHKDNVFSSSNSNIICYGLKGRLNPVLLQLNFNKGNKYEKIVSSFSYFRFVHNKENDKNSLFSLKKMIKIFVVYSSKKNSGCSFVALVLRGDHQLDYKKIERLSHVLSPLVFASDEEVCFLFNNFNMNWVNLENFSFPIIVDNSIYSIVVGILFKKNICKSFDLKYKVSLLEKSSLKKFSYIKLSMEHESKFKIENTIEVAHIFQLGLKYSKIMKAFFLGKNGKKQIINMGCYGIGITRLVAAIIEQNHDKYGILWPENLAPFSVAILPINMYKSFQVKEISEIIYRQLTKEKIDVLFDDRNERPGVMFSDIELIGIPHILIISDRNIQKKNIEYKNRRNGRSEIIKISSLVDFLLKKIFCF